MDPQGPKPHPTGTPPEALEAVRALIERLETAIQSFTDGLAADITQAIMEQQALANERFAESFAKVLTPRLLELLELELNSTAEAGCMSRTEVAAYLGLGTSTLEQMAARGEGPPCSKVGRRVVYRRRDVEAYLDAAIGGKSDG